MTESRDIMGLIFQYACVIKQSNQLTRQSYAANIAKQQPHCLAKCIET